MMAGVSAILLIYFFTRRVTFLDQKAGNIFRVVRYEAQNILNKSMRLAFTRLIIDGLSEVQKFP